MALHTDQGDHYRTISAAGGYLSGDPARVHFGFPSNASLQQLEVRWPDGRTSTITNPQPGTLLTLARK